MNRSYKIQPRLASLGGGWNLKLYENNQEAGGGVYPVREDDPKAGMDWWNGLPETRRANWLMMAVVSHAVRSAPCLSACEGLQRCHE